MNISETEPSEYNFWLVGSSIVRDLIPNFNLQIQKNKSYHIKRQNNIRATEFLKLGKISTNDLEEKSPEEAMREMESLILSKQKTLPKSEIVIKFMKPSV